MSGKLIVGITGASGVIYGIRLLEAVRKYAENVSAHLVMSPAGGKNVLIETGYTVDQVKSLAEDASDHSDLAAAISSGSCVTMGMVVAPCSIRTLSDIAHSNCNNLLARAADVTLKERRKLVLVPRETPLHKGHIKLMAKAADIGAVILPPFPAFYHRPKTIDDIINHTIGKIFDQFGLEHDLYDRWRG